MPPAFFENSAVVSEMNVICNKQVGQAMPDKI
jgi:hypothetical protein